MAINIGYNGVQTSFGHDDFYNGFPNSTPAVVATGVDTQEISILESQKYTIDIYNDMKHFAPKEFPLYTLLSNMGGGTIDRFFDMWTDEYEGTDVIDVALDQLRLRDSVGDTSVTPASPFALGELGEIGGEFIWQYASLDGATVSTPDFDGLADSANIKIKAIGTPSRPSTVAAYQAAYLDKIKIKEISPVENSTDSKKLVALGFYRTGTTTETYGNVVGRMSETIRKFQNTLEVNDYDATSFSGVTLNGGTGEVWYEYKYTANSSYLVHQIIDNLSTADASTYSAVNEEQKIQVIVGINRLLFNASLSAFIIELDFNESNLDFLNGTTGTAVGGAALVAGVAYGYYQLTSVVNGSAATYPVGTIYRYDASGLWDAQGNDLSATLNNDTNFIFQKVRYTLLLEETNSAVNNYRTFGSNIGSTYANPQGCTRFARHITINRFDDVPAPNSELDGFDTELKGNYTRTNEIHQNYLQIYNMKPWAISTMRQGTGIRFGDTVKLSRERHLRQYKQAWTNIFLYGKKANFSLSETNYKGQTSGLFDFEMFPMKYGSFPIPYSPTGMTSSDTIKGTKFKRWMEDFARACNATSVPGTYEGKTVFVGIEFINYITTMVAAIGSSNTYNVFGAQFQLVPPTKATFGLEVYEFKTTFGTLRFIHEPALDYITKFKVPRFLFASGKLSPRYTAIVIDKNYIEVMTHKTRPDRIYGNLQANNQPFMQMEGISGAKLLKLRFPRNFGVFNLEPNY